MSDPLQRLLEQADAALAPTRGETPRPEAIVCSVQRRLKRRRRWRRGSSVAVIALATLGLGALFWSGANRSPASSQEQLDQLVAERDQIRSEIEASHRRIESLHRIELLEQQLQEIRIEFTLNSPQQRFQRELDQTARIILNQADRKHRDLGLSASAADDYQSIIDIFPDTPWAQLAHNRIADIQNQMP